MNRRTSGGPFNAFKGETLPQWFLNEIFIIVNILIQLEGVVSQKIYSEYDSFTKCSHLTQTLFLLVRKPCSQMLSFVPFLPLPSSSHLSTIHLLHFPSPLYIHESPRDLHQPTPTEALRFLPPAGRDLIITAYFILRSLYSCADTSVINTATNCTAHSFDPTWAMTVIICHFSRPLKTLHKAQSTFPHLHSFICWRQRQWAGWGSVSYSNTLWHVTQKS